MFKATDVRIGKLGGFAFKDNSGIESLLEKPSHEITLEKVLDEEDLLQEIKVHNARLLDYLRQESVLSQLLDLIIEDHEDEKKAFKYAFVACEVLSCEVWSICETIFENPHLLQKFWSFIDSDPPLNPLRASYFTKVNEKFLEKKTEDMIPFIQSIPDVLQKILRHSDTSAIMDLLLKIISMERTDVGAGVVEWLYDEGLLDALTSHLYPEVDPDIQTTVADVIKAIIAISANSNDQGVIGPNALSRNLVSGPVISKLVANMVRPTEDGSNASLTTGVSIVIELIRKNNSDYDLTPIMALAFNNQAPTSRDPIYLGTMLRVFADSIQGFQNLLLSPKNVRMIKTSGYGDIESLGFERFRICELYAELLHCSNMALLNDPRGEAVVRERDAERNRLKALQKDTTADSRSGRVAEHDDTDAEKDSSSVYGTRASSSGRDSAFGTHDEIDEAFLIEKDQIPSGSSGSPQSREARRRSSSEERRKRPEERRGSRGSMDEESRPYMPAISPHVIEGVAVPTSSADEAAQEQKIIADIGPQSHPVPMPETHSVTTSEPSTLRVLEGSAIESRTPSPPAVKSEEIASQTASPGEQIHNTSNQTIEQDISTATGEQITTPHSEPVSTPPPIDLNIDLDNITSIPTSLDPSALEDDCSTPRGNVPASDHSDTLSITSTSSSQIPSEPFEPVIGDYLKMQFMNHHVISTILELFFKFPWNNFLHNVVYDVVQQVFNGPMDRGYNRVLAIDVFAQGKLCEKIVAGQKASDDHVSGDGVRLGYMGHLTLIAEEVVKFVDRYPPHQMSALIAEKVTAPEWVEYVENTLAATRARDSAILGGERPQVPPPPQQQLPTSMAWEMGERSYDVEEDDEELQRRMGQFAMQDESETSDQFANYISQQISNDVPDKFGSSDEEDEDDDQELSEWMNDRGDFLRSRSFSRYEDADDEQVESLDDTSPTNDDSFDDSTELKASPVDDSLLGMSPPTIIDHNYAMSSSPIDPISTHLNTISNDDDDTTERTVGEEEDEDIMDAEEEERAPTPEGGPLPQSASPAPRRQSLDDEGDDA